MLSNSEQENYELEMFSSSDKPPEDITIVNEC
jgi:hypothetical protein